MHHDMPIEQLVRRNDTRFQLGFASEARQSLPEGKDFALRSIREGLLVLARNEEGLAHPVRILRGIYGPKLEVLRPRVRLIGGVQVKEPIMQVRVSLQSRYVEAVARAMLGRGATPSEEHARGRYCVLRYEAPLADLLGLQPELSRITDGSATCWVALSHYALVTRDPGGDAA
jgi:predicted membrane GTPase involved in stress response